jgi:hypothetical protein
VPGRDDSCSVQPSPASCATCRGTWVVPRALALTHRHPHKSPCVRRPFAEISGSISYPSTVVPFPETGPYFCVSLQGFTPFGHLFPFGRASRGARRCFFSFFRCGCALFSTDRRKGRMRTFMGCAFACSLAIYSALALSALFGIASQHLAQSHHSILPALEAT